MLVRHSRKLFFSIAIVLLGLWGAGVAAVTTESLEQPLQIQRQALKEALQAAWETHGTAFCPPATPGD